MIVFNEIDHTYFNTETKEYYTSVTKLISLFKQPFDSDYWSLYNAGRRLLGISDEDKKEYSKLLMSKGLDFGNKTIENLKKALQEVLGLQYALLFNEQSTEQRRWKDITKTATDAGTKIHKEKEDSLIALGVDINRFGLTTKVNLKDLYDVVNLYELEDGVYPELMIWNNNYKVSGISDKVTVDTIGGIRYVDIDDYKTNKKIDVTSYLNPSTSDYTRMLHPVTELMDCNKVHYSVQLSMYAYFLELFGFVVRNIKFTHLILNENKKVVSEQPYEVEYLRPFVIKILEHHGRSNNK